MTWDDERRARRIREACDRVRSRLLALPREQATGSVTVHLSDGIVRRVEWRLLEDADRWEDG